MSSRYNVQPKTQPNRGPPARPQPSGPKPPGPKPNQDVVKRLQALITEKDTRIEKLTERVNTLAMENNKLKQKVETLEKVTASKKSTPAAGAGAPKTGAGIDTGMGTKGAANALAGLLGGHVKNKKMAEAKASTKSSGDGAIDTGMGTKGAANALAGLMGGRVKNPKMAASGVESGPTQKNAAAALGAMLMKKPKPSPSPSPAASASASGGGGGGGGGGKDDPAQYAKLFKKYEMMMKLGINVHGAVGRMRQDGIEKHIIAVFEKKHGAVEETTGGKPEDFGLVSKKEVPVSKGIKMKRLHWDGVELKTVKGSIWEDLDEASIKYDRKHFELHFQVRQIKPPSASDEQKQQVPTGQILTFVSKKRTQAVLIGLRNLNMDNERLRTVLHNMDAAVMNVDTLSKLLEMVPTMEEQTEAEKKIMQEGTRRAKDYGTAEQFFYALYDFYNISTRLKLWMFEQNFREICESLLDQYKTIGKACDKIRNNKNLRLLLTIILAFGNHMNSGTRKGQTFGFDLKILTGMTAVKSFDNTRSLLMYVYEFCDRKYPAAIKVLDELRDTLKAASSMEAETLKQAHQRIQDNMHEIKNLITSDEIENYDLDDKFIMVLTRFHKESAPRMKKFNMTVGNVMVSTKRVMKKYCYGSDEQPQSIESFFQIFYKFVQDFAAAKEKLIVLEKDRQKRIAARKKAKEREKQKQLHEKYGNKGGGPPKRGLPGGPAAAVEEDVEEVQQLRRGSTLHQELEKRNQFDKKKGDLHKRLGGHMKQRSIFIANGGKLDQNQPQNDTMRRLSSIYQGAQDEAKAMDDARRIAAIKNYNKFRLPQVGSEQRFKIDAKENFVIPDNQAMMAPKGNQQRNTHQMPMAPPGRGGGGGGGGNPQQQFGQRNNNAFAKPLPQQQQQFGNNNQWQKNPQFGGGANKQNFAFQKQKQQQARPHANGHR